MINFWTVYFAEMEKSFEIVLAMYVSNLTEP